MPLQQKAHYASVAITLGWRSLTVKRLLQAETGKSRPSANLNSTKGFAQIAVYVHDAEPGAAGRGGFLADIILNDKPDYIGTGEDGWRCDTGEPIADRKDDWMEVDFDDSDWEDELEIYEQFGGGIWGFGAAIMEQILKDPECEANWVWCGPNDAEDDIYFRYTIGTLSVEPEDKLTTTWARIKRETL